MTEHAESLPEAINCLPMPPVKTPKPDQSDTLLKILEEQRKTNDLLVMLIEALAEDDGEDGEHEPTRYLDGSSVHG